MLQRNSTQLSPWNALGAPCTATEVANRPVLPSKCKFSALWKKHALGFKHSISAITHLPR